MKSRLIVTFTLENIIRKVNLLDSGAKYKFLLDYAQLGITSLSVWLIPSINVGDPELGATIDMLKVKKVII